MFKKRFIVFLLSLMGYSFSITVFADVNDQSVKGISPGTIQPQWTEIAMFENSFDISGTGKASISVLLYAFDADNLEVVANLQQYRNGSWVTIKSWSKTSADISVSIEATWYVASGYSYRLVSTGTVYENGIQVEQTTYISNAYWY